MELYFSCLFFSVLKWHITVVMLQNRKDATTCLACVSLLKKKYSESDSCPTVASLCSNTILYTSCLPVSPLCSKVLEYTRYHLNHGSLKITKQDSDALFFLCLSKAWGDITCLWTVSLFCSNITLCSSQIWCYIKSHIAVKHVRPLLCFQKRIWSFMFQMSSTICDVCGLCRLFLLKYTSFFLKLWYTSNIHNQTPCLVFFSSFKKKLAAAVCSKSSIPTAIYLRIISTVCSNILIFFSQTYIAVSDVCFSLFLQKRLQSVYTPTRNVDR